MHDVVEWHVPFPSERSFDVCTTSAISDELFGAAITPAIATGTALYQTLVTYPNSEQMEIYLIARYLTSTL